MHRDSRDLALLMLLLCVASCATTSPEETLRRRLDFARERVVAFSADVTVTLASTTKSAHHNDRVWVRRPDQMRFERTHSDGSARQIIAINGDVVAMVNFETHSCGHGVLKYGFFEKVLDLAPLQMDAPALVSMAFGDLILPDDARISYDGNVATWRWQSKRNNIVAMNQDVQSGLPTHVAATSPSGAEILDVSFASRDASGIPQLVTMYAGATERSLEARLRNVAYNPSMQATLFAPEMPEPCKSPDADWVLKSF